LPCGSRSNFSLRPSPAAGRSCRLQTH
jgi:hypothetical protein